MKNKKVIIVKLAVGVPVTQFSLHLSIGIMIFFSQTDAFSESQTAAITKTSTMSFLRLLPGQQSTKIKEYQLDCLNLGMSY